MLKKRILVITALFVLVATASAITTFMAESNNANADQRIHKTIVVADLREASGFVNHDVKTPAFVPDGLVSNGARVEQSAYPYPSLLQTWSDQDSSGGIFLEIQKGARLSSGVPAMVGGRRGERAVYGPNDKRPYGLEVLWWDDNGVGYTLVGIMSGDPVSSNALDNMAASIQ